MFFFINLMSYKESSRDKISTAVTLRTLGLKTKTKPNQTKTNRFQLKIPQLHLVLYVRFWVKDSQHKTFNSDGQWEGTWGREETSGLTLTSAFLFRRLLAAAERQNDTPSDGRVHIIPSLMRPRLWVCSLCSGHAWAASLPAHQSTADVKKKASTPISPHVRTFSTLNQTLGRGVSPEEKSSLPLKTKNPPSIL